MAQVIVEPSVGLKDAPAPVSPEGAPNKTGPRDERSYALSLTKHPRGPVLDVGTGDCACVATILARQGTRVVALDKDHERILAARMCLRAWNVKKAVWLLQDDITVSGLISSSFRNIVCFNVLHHVARFDSALAELRRILTPDGRLIISDFDENGDGFLKRLEQAVGHHFRSVAAYRRPSGRLVLTCEK